MEGSVVVVLVGCVGVVVVDGVVLVDGVWLVPCPLCMSSMTPKAIRPRRIRTLAIHPASAAGLRYHGVGAASSSGSTNGGDSSSGGVSEGGETVGGGPPAEGRPLTP